MAENTYFHFQQEKQQPWWSISVLTQLIFNLFVLLIET